jgi:hypothetical protein
VPGSSLAELVEIQRLQHTDLDGARARALAWMRSECSLDVTSVELVPRPVSLNSFSGTAVVDGRTLFFKSHIDPDGAVAEYYNSSVLAEAGYNVVAPVLGEREAGRQIVFYPVVSWPLLFDEVHEVERRGGADPGATPLLAAERRECDRLLDIYTATAAETDASANAAAPVHQLFWHRLTGGRLERFYAGTSIAMPSGRALPFEEVSRCRWVVNGVAQPRSLATLIDDARVELDPRRPATTVVGHGDAHYGNVFLEAGNRFLYFDPAFAGRHSPMLDLAKPLFHNVFADWMYFPRERVDEVSVAVRHRAGTIEIDYRDVLSALRGSLLRTKQEALIEPLLSRRRAEHAESPDRRSLHLALMCCPLLTMNLVDATRFPPAIGWIGLALAVQMGNWGTEQDFAFGERSRGGAAVTTGLLR